MVMASSSTTSPTVLPSSETLLSDSVSVALASAAASAIFWAAATKSSFLATKSVSLLS
jgi:preprotein translocase subunit SecE